MTSEPPFALHQNKFKVTVQFAKQWLGLLFAASKSHILRVPDCEPAQTNSSLPLNWTHSTGLVWPDKL